MCVHLQWIEKKLESLKTHKSNPWFSKQHFFPLFFHFFQWMYKSSSCKRTDDTVSVEKNNDEFVN